ncbi:class I SAM-dependent methyltransferase [Candidatus Binatus sp.]|uniref:class I SAM-dependent methyltransferase n=1 Tax=Candidatus Binatus sp. TaxID=2811406 RepID=UPI002F94893A
MIRRVAHHAGEIGPESYETWRATSLGRITEDLEQQLIMRMAGPLKGRRILDVGCGDGALTLACWRRGASLVMGCDIDHRMIVSATAQASRHKAEIGYTVGRTECLPFRDRSFDLVTAIALLAFVPEAQSAVGEMARVLRPGGHLVIGDLGKWSLWAASRRIRGWMGSETWREARFRTASELRELAENARLYAQPASGAIYYPQLALLAGLMAPMDPLLGQLTTVGAAFLAVKATKPIDK